MASTTFSLFKKRSMGNAPHRRPRRGDARHPTSSSQMKHRLVEFLSSEMGFTLFAIEANLPEAAQDQRLRPQRSREIPGRRSKACTSGPGTPRRCST